MGLIVYFTFASNIFYTFPGGANNYRGVQLSQGLQISLRGVRTPPLNPAILVCSFFSGNQNHKHQGGVCLLIIERTEKIPISPRLEFNPSQRVPTKHNNVSKFGAKWYNASFFLPCLSGGGLCLGELCPLTFFQCPIYIFQFQFFNICSTLSFLPYKIILRADTLINLRRFSSTYCRTLLTRFKIF